MTRDEVGHWPVLPVVLQSRDPKAANTVIVDKPLPGLKLFGGNIVSLASFLQSEETSADGSDDFGLTAADPSLCIGWWKGL